MRCAVYDLLIYYNMYVTHTFYSSHSTSTRHFTRTHTCKIRSGPTAQMHIYIIGNILGILIGRISRASSSSLEVCAAAAAARLQIDRRDNKRRYLYIYTHECKCVCVCVALFWHCVNATSAFVRCVCVCMYRRHNLRVTRAYCIFFTRFLLTAENHSTQAPRRRRYAASCSGTVSRMVVGRYNIIILFLGVVFYLQFLPRKLFSTKCPFHISTAR